MDVERRVSPRRPANLFFNKYIDGHPHACEALEISATGMLVRKIHEPDQERACYAIELAPAADLESGVSPPSVWLCATPVWSLGPVEALRFVAQSPEDAARLEALAGSLTSSTSLS
jgi:hypothetical protein